MRTSFVISVLSVLLYTAGLSVSDEARAQGTIAVGTGNCAATVSTEFSPGLSLSSNQQTMAVNAVLTGCAFVNASSTSVSIATPYRLVWQGTITGATCLAILAQTHPVGTGTLYWENNQTSTVQFRSLTYTNLTGVVPAEMIFDITGGYQSGASFVVNAALVPTAYAALQCSGSLLSNTAVNEISGAVPTIVFDNINLSL